MTSPNSRVAVVTGANKGIGLEISKQLASNGVTVILTARDISRGTDAVKTLHDKGLANVIFHQLDVTVTDKPSVTALAGFVKTQFGKLVILVNNAGIVASRILKWEGLTFTDDQVIGATAKLFKPVIRQTYEDAAHCVKTNYYGVKLLTKELLPLLQLSTSPRVVNVSSTFGLLKYVTNEEAKAELSNIDTLTEQKVDKIVEGFLHDLKEGKEEEKGWPTNFSAYIVSKAAVNAYARITAKEQHGIITVNCVCPGYTKTDINDNTGVFSVEEGAEGPVMLALMSEKQPSGMFFSQTKQLSTF